MSDPPRKTFGHCLQATMEQWRDEATQANGFELLRSILTSAATKAGYEPPGEFSYFLRVHPDGELPQTVPVQTSLPELEALTQSSGGRFILCGEGETVRSSGPDEIGRLREVAQAAADFAWFVGPGDDPDMADEHARLWDQLRSKLKAVEIYPSPEP